MAIPFCKVNEAATTTKFGATGEIQAHTRQRRCGRRSAKPIATELRSAAAEGSGTAAKARSMSERKAGLNSASCASLGLGP